MLKKIRLFFLFLLTKVLVMTSIFVAPLQLSQVQAAQGDVTLLAGGAGVDGPASTLTMGFNPAVAIDNAGNVYLSHFGIARIVRFNPSTGMASVFAGTGTNSFGGDGGPAGDSAIGVQIEGMTIDHNGDLIFNDKQNNRIRKVDLGTGIISTIAGDGTAGTGGDGGPATSAQISGATGIAVDSVGNIYVTQSRRIRRIDAATGIISTYAGDGTFGYSGDGGLATAAQLPGPNELVLDSSDNLIIADESCHCLRRVDAGTGIITTIAGNGTGGFAGDGGPATASQLNFPRGLAFDAAGNLYIGDASNNRVRVIDTSGDISTFSGSGQGYSGDGGPAAAAQYNRPNEIEIDNAGNIYIADTGNYYLRRIDAGTGNIDSVYGNGSNFFEGDGQLAREVPLVNIADVVFDQSGNLYIADGGNYIIRKVDAITGLISTVVGTPSISLPSSSGDGGPATSALLAAPGGIAIAPNGDIYNTDRNGHRVRKTDAVTGIITTVAGTGSGGYSGDGGPATSAQLNFPDRLQLDSNGNLFIAEQVGTRIRRVDAITGIITTFAGDGTFTSNGDGGPASAASVAQPRDIDFDANGNLFIAEFAGSRIRRIDGTTGIISSYLGNGVAGFACQADNGDGGPASEACISQPFSVAVDAFGNVYGGDAFRFLRKVDVVSGIVTSINDSSGLTSPFPESETLDTLVTGGFNTMIFDSQGNLVTSNSSRVLSIEGVATAPLEVVSTTPAAAAINVSANSGIQVVFQDSIDGTTANSTNMPVWSGFKGLLSGTYNLSTTTVSNDTITFTPDEAFLAGDRVSYTVSPNIKSSSGGTARFFSREFIVASTSGTGDFSTRNDVNGTADTYGITAGDFDGDGFVDIVTANRISNNASIYINDQAGNFTAPTVIATGAQPVTPLAADLNNNSDLDLVFSYNQGSGTFISVLLGNGDGTFQARVDYTTGQGPRGLTLKDLNNDGFIDITTGNISDDNFSVLINNGDGTFATHVTYPTGDNLFDLEAGDLNNDGFADMVTADFGDSAITVHFNDGDGSFTLNADYSVPRSTEALDIADVNGDGFNDIIAISNGGGGADVSVFINNGDGTFAAAVNYGIPNAAIDVLVGDFDADGDLDIAAANQNDSLLTTFLNDGTGTFGAANDFDGAAFNNQLITADIDGDGSLDIVSTTGGVPPGIGVHLNVEAEAASGRRRSEDGPSSASADSESSSTTGDDQDGARRGAAPAEGEGRDIGGEQSADSKGDRRSEEPSEGLLTASQQLKELLQLFAWIEEADYELMPMGRGLKKSYQSFFTLRRTIKSLAHGLGYGDGYEYREPLKQEVENVAELLKMIAVEFETCFEDDLLLRMLSHDTLENEWWWAGYWHILGELVQGPYELWSPIQEYNVLEILQGFVLNFCEQPEIPDFETAALEEQLEEDEEAEDPEEEEENEASEEEMESQE